MNDRAITNLRFNQNKDCFSCCTQSGFRLYNVEPLAEKARIEMDFVGSVAICEMLLRSNLIAIVAGGPRSQFMDNVLHIYDDITKKFILEITFPSTIRGVRLKTNKIAVVLYDYVYVFEFPSPTRKLFSMETINNPFGLCEFGSPYGTPFEYLFLPGRRLGSVEMLDLRHKRDTSSSVPAYLRGHKGEIAQLSVNQDASLIATASVKGTLIRVWDVLKKTLKFEFRRGSDQAKIYCINFSNKSDFLCCSSDKGTVHMFAMKSPELNRRTIMRKASILGDYGNSQWAFANFTVPPECACICAFTSTNAVVVACLDGSFHKYVFSDNGTCNREAYDVFLDLCDDDEIL